MMAISSQMTSAAMRHIDARLISDSELSTRLTRPPKGWIRTIREALGMSAAQLARRVGVSQPVVTTIEASEVAGTVKLATLERMATALNCRLVYALLPYEPLEDMARKRALDVAEQHLSRVEHSMRLENQAVTDKSERQRQINSLLAEIDTA